MNLRKGQQIVSNINDRRSTPEKCPSKLVAPLYATTGRVLAHYQSGAQTRRVAELNQAAPGSFVQVHPDTAARSGLSEGALVRVSSARGSLTAPVRLDPTMRLDTVFVPFHWVG